MPQPISLGTVLGGRYKVLDEVLTTPERDYVLGGQDQILGREVTILVPSERHTSRVVENARAMAIGVVDADLHILDLGQSGSTTYLVTSFAAPSVLIEELLSEPGMVDDETLSDDIFGRPRSAGTAGTYVVDDGEPDAVGEETSEEFFDRWDDDIDTAPAAPEMEKHLGRIKRAPESSTRATLFDRAAAGRGSAPNKAPVRDTHRIDPTYDGDNRYDSYEYEYTSGSKARGSGAGGATEALSRNAVRARSQQGAAGSTAKDTRGHKSGKGGLLALLVILLAVLGLGAALVFGGLGNLFSGAGVGGDDETAAPTDAASEPTVTSSPVAAIRLVPDDPTFMADQDASLDQAIDEDPETAWVSYGFSSADFSQLISSVGLAVRFEEPTAMNQVSISQISGTGGSFTVYVADEPSLENAVEVGQGTFQGQQATVQLGEAAQTEEHSYLIIEWTELPTITQPIAGYNYGLRISDINVT